MSSSKIDWSVYLPQRYLSLERKYPRVMHASYDQFQNVKLQTTIGTHTLKGLTYSFFQGVLSDVAREFTRKVSSSKHSNHEDLFRVFLSDSLRSVGIISENRAHLFLCRTLDYTVVDNSDYILNELAVEWFDRTNFLVKRVNSYHTNLVSQIQHLQTIFKKVTVGEGEPGGITESMFTLEAGYTKLDIARYQAYIKAVRAKTKAIDGVNVGLSELAKDWIADFIQLEKKLQRLVDTFASEKKLERRDLIFKECQVVVEKLVSSLEDKHTKLQSLMTRFNDLKSSVETIPYMVYVLYNDLEYIQRYITELADNQKLYDAVKSAKSDLEKQKQRYTDYFGKVHEYYKFKDFFMYDLCDGFNRESEILACCVLSEKGVN